MKFRSRHWDPSQLQEADKQHVLYDCGSNSLDSELAEEEIHEL